MIRMLSKRKRIATGLLLLMSLNILLPQLCLALTSGPAQPEARSFQPAGVSDMVDLFTGDFKYNVPLLDVDGYPINLNYESGAGMDDEASWVGLGWNVNVGSINRQVRGLPDDMAGDNIQTDHYTKPKVTLGARITGKFEFFQLGKLVTPSGSFGLGIFNDNYTGIGADISANAGISFSTENETPFTSSLGIGLSSSTASGVDVTPSLSLSVSEDVNKNNTVSAGLSASLGYNSRSGLKSLTLGSTYSVTGGKDADPEKDYKDDDHGGSVSGGVSGSAISYNTEPILPNINIPYRARYGSFSIDVGFAAFGGFLSIGGTGYKNVRSVASEILNNPAYGFLYAERGKNQKTAMMDFIREKENPVIPELPNIALPVTTPDLFSYTSQVGSGQFRLFRGGSGAYFDNQVSDDDGTTTVGGDLGFGPSGLNHLGVTYFNQGGSNTTRKWVSNNNYLGSGDFQDVSYTNPNAQQVYFKVVGEKTAEDASMVSRLHDIQPLEVSISGKTANAQFTNNSLSSLQKQNRAINKTSISYLTAQESMAAGLDKNIKNYPINDAATFEPAPNNCPTPVTCYQRVDNYHQPHHLSEITVTDGAGKRMVYGLPVYNVKQTEYSFAIGQNQTDYTVLPGTNNTVKLPISGSGPSATITHTKGIDNYYHSQTQPAYASSFLLTGILSPDYVDKTGDGISADDAGTAIKFNYSKLPNLYKWRSPFNGATLNKGLLADKDDDKASVVYGEKEIWYISSIESKTKVAYFITQNRSDAMGVTDFTGMGPDVANPQKCLEEIRLYSKADMSKPIKVVKFEYSYELCRGVPNNSDNVNGVTSSDPSKGGKLTLKKVYFEYANSPKGANYPYIFNYANTAVNGQTVNYGDMLTDRWGVYKSPSQNQPNLRNDEFPYTSQDIQGNNAQVKATVDQDAALWHLSSIQLPTGGLINVTYESDDYAYVQNKRAMVMSGVMSLINAGGSPIDSTNFRNAKGVRIQIPNTAYTGDPTSWFKQNYLNGSDYLYSKFSVQVSTPNSNSGGDNYDFIPCYSFVQSVTFGPGYANVVFQDRNDGGVIENPIIFSAWQTMKDVYPRYAYPGFDRRASDGAASSSITSAVKALLSSIGNLSELTENFFHKAFRSSYANNIQLSRCFVKVVKQDGHKLGGGLRVKKIQISDSWSTMASNTNQPNANYGQAYDYTTVDNGQTISSGVAAYEPSIGNDENPLRQPVPYIEKIKGSVDSYFDLEQPFGESFFPAPSVGYSKVTVTDLDKNGNPDPTLRTGYTVNEFYTAKDYPVQVTVMPLNQNENKPVNHFSFLGATSIDELTMSQGYSIVLNDMHGKQKATTIYNQSASVISSTQYCYNSTKTSADTYALKNTVNIVNPDGSVSSNQVIGRDIDFFTDFREFESKNSGRSIDSGYDLIGFFFFNLPIFMFPSYDDSDYKLFRSACAVKTSQYYGFVDKVIKTENGSTITTQNLAYDGATGEAVVTRTQNEFNHSIYSTNLPAYWVYKGMGPAYQNEGIVFKNFTTDANGGSAAFGSFLKAGDEIVDIGSRIKYWVVESVNKGSSYYTKKLIDVNGKLALSVTMGMAKLVRSGYRNLLDEQTSSLVSLTNPIHRGQLVFKADTDLTAVKVINASAKTFSERWPMPPGHKAGDSTAIANTSASFSYGINTPQSGHGLSGAYIYNGDGITGTVIQNAFLQAGFDRSGVWPAPSNLQLLNEPVGFETTVNVPASNWYYIGYSGDDSYLFTVDHVPLPSSQTCVYWSVYQIYLTAGTHQLTFQDINLPENGTVDNETTNPGGIAMEIYNCTPSQLLSGKSLNTIFTTRSVANVSTLQSFRTINGARVYHYTNVKDVNPYIYGFLGNWRERTSMVFQQSRHYNTTSTTKGMDIPNAGYINSFSPYWYYGNYPNGYAAWKTDSLNNRSRWVAANTVTLYDQYGQQLENRDALGRYSAALFNFNGELPGAVASNAKNREIYSLAFEDSFFTPGSGNAAAQPNTFSQTGTNTPMKQFIVSSQAHSGNYSLLLPSGGLSLTANTYTKAIGTDTLLLNDFLGEYNLKAGNGIYPNGFEPSPGKKYIFDVWVQDYHNKDKSVNLNLSLNGTSVPLTCNAIVENWKLLEGTIDLTSLPAGSITLALTSSLSQIYIDDLRIHPFDSQMKTYAYDDKTMRLMAEIDENGFATFYEYDDEGLLVRVKKETQRGVMTIKESRSSYKKGS
jgi:hypothetical protein